MRFWSPRVAAASSCRRSKLRKLRQARKKKKCLLLANAGPLNAALCDMLQRLKIDVACAPDQVSFFKALEEKKPDIAFLDARSAGVWQILKAREPNNDNYSPAPQIIACFGRGQEAQALHALQNGADDYLAMPFDFAILRSKLETLGLSVL